MQIELSASVYSVASVLYTDVDRLKRYLYDHTTVVDLPGYSIADAFSDKPKIVPVVLKTTVTATIDSEYKGNLPDGRDAIDRAFYLANYQLDRLASGALGGILAGTLNDAKELALDVLNA